MIFAWEALVMFLGEKWKKKSENVAVESVMRQ
jgi:hypothetical protein